MLKTRHAINLTIANSGLIPPQVKRKSCGFIMDDATRKVISGCNGKPSRNNDTTIGSEPYVHSGDIIPTSAAVVVVKNGLEFDFVKISVHFTN